MNLPIEHLATFLGLLLVASLCDLESRRIPNAVSVALLLAGLGAQWVNGGLLALGQGLAAALAVLALLGMVWARGWLGAGDVKLAVGAACWLGLRDVPWFLLAAAVAGGPLALGAWALAPERARARVGRSLTLLFGTGARVEPARVGEGAIAVPYAVAICAGAFATLFVPR